MMNSEDLPPVTEGDQDGSPAKEKPPLTRHQKIVFCGIAASYIFNLMSFSIMAPFFPIEAQKKGVTPTQIGFIFALFNLVNFLMSPVFGKYLPVLGAKYLFLAGAFVSAGCNVLFGTLDWVDDERMFLIFCYVIRTVEACGSAASITASMTITANTFPNNMAQMMGILESFSGVGFMVGPPLGGLFYHIGGYPLPFFVLGGISVATVVFNYFLLPQVGVNRTETGSIKNMFLIPAFYPLAMAIIVGSACMGFLDPTLALHLSTYGLDPAQVGVAFLLIGGLYAICSPLWGYLADKKKNTRIMMVLGLYLSTICYLLLGPSQLLQLPSSLWIVLFSLGMIGVCLGAALMPVFLDLFITAQWYGYPDDLSTQSVITGLFNSFFSLGAFIGPLLGGYLVDKYNFSWASTVFALANLFVMLVICVLGLWEWPCGRGRRPPWIRFDEPSTVVGYGREREPLLQNHVNDIVQYEAVKA